MSSIAFSEQIAENPDGLALADERSRVSWSEADDVVTRAANGLLGLDLGADRRIAIFAENSIETVLAHIAGILAGAQG